MGIFQNKIQIGDKATAKGSCWWTKILGNGDKLAVSGEKKPPGPRVSANDCDSRHPERRIENGQGRERGGRGGCSNIYGQNGVRLAKRVVGEQNGRGKGKDENEFPKDGRGGGEVARGNTRERRKKPKGTERERGENDNDARNNYENEQKEGKGRGGNGTLGEEGGGGGISLMANEQRRKRWTCKGKKLAKCGKTRHNKQTKTLLDFVIGGETEG